MKVRFGSVVPVCLLVAGSCLFAVPAASAQNQSGQTTQPPKYLYLTNEAEKPGVDAAHSKNEAAISQALSNANSSFHSIALVAITGNPRVIFFHGFDSFADLAKEHMSMVSNKDLENTLESDNTTDGTFLKETSNSIYKYREDLSLRAPVDLPQMRIFDMTLYVVKPGHVKDFETLAKTYAKAFDSIPGMHWAVFQKMYGVDSDDAFIVASPLKRMADVDQEVMDGQKLSSTMSQDEMQNLRDLAARTIQSSESDLFGVSRKMSYVPAAWKTASPDFWGKQ